ncbi:SDR family NAD(P)-dependent oxidoreductase [Altererythrobacter fulvus]|uniref:SDR family NAD(P)-dependent oxidoreductase n=1 Tax=Caenibius fulvus TaxID=2126012 RepID=UPI00301A4280
MGSQGRLAGKIALVTGGSRGIGAGIVRRFAAEGASVAFTYRASAEAARQIVEEIEADGGRALAIEADSADAAAVERAVAGTAAHFGGLDILVNNAGGGTPELIGEATLANYEHIFAVHVRAAFVAMNEAAKIMPNGGRIITIGSINARRLPFTYGALYSATKAALVGLTKGAARDLGPKGITVNVIEPGPIDTDLNPADGPWAAPALAALAMGRFGKASDVAGLAAYLASEEGRFITGAELAIDGGYSI